MSTIFGGSVSDEAISFYRIGTTSIIPRDPIISYAAGINTTTIGVYWSAPGTETGGYYTYNELWYSTDNVNFSFLSYVYGTSTSVGSLSSGVTYYFKVRSVYQVGGVNYPSYGYSGVASATVLTAITGGTAFSYGGYNYNVLTSSGSLTINVAKYIDITVVGGGGGGGGWKGGGGGGGGVWRHTNLYATTGTLSVTIGSGGGGGVYGNGSSGSQTYASIPNWGTVYASGGGYGSGGYYTSSYAGSPNPYYYNYSLQYYANGCSGGGGYYYGGLYGGYYTSTGASYNGGGISNLQAYYGGGAAWYAGTYYYGIGGGGGGAGANQQWYIYNTNYNGGSGYYYSPLNVYFSAGGGGGGNPGWGYGSGGSYGAGNGGTGYGEQYYSYPSGAGGNASLINNGYSSNVKSGYGSGGGGGSAYNGRGGSGYSGIVIVKWS